MLSFDVESTSEHGSGGTIAKDWFEYLGLDTYCCTFVRGLGQRESLARIGADPNKFRIVAYYREVIAAALQDPTMKCVVAVRLDGWTLLVERGGAEGLESALCLSSGTEVFTAYLGFGADRGLRYVRDGVVLAAFDDGELGHLVGWGTQPDLLAPFIERIGTQKFQDFDEDGVPPDLELACLVTGVQLRQEDFRGPLLCADLGRRPAVVGVKASR